MIVRYPKITKEMLQSYSSHLIEQNFIKIEPFFMSRSDFFHEIVPLFREINMCLLLDCFIATVTLTNHTLEKILKLSLIYNEMGITRKHFKQPDFYKTAHEKFQNSDLSQTINSCCSSGLITKEHKKYLQNEVLEQLRNGFSHSDPSKIIEPKKGKKLYTPAGKSTEEDLRDLVFDPMLQSQMIASFAQHEAFNYYKNVVAITLHIQSVLITKERTRTY